MGLAPGVRYDGFIGQRPMPASFAPSMVGEEKRKSVVEEEAITRGGAFDEFEASWDVPLACQGCAEQRVLLLGREDHRREEGARP